MNKYIIVLVVFLLLIPVISYGESETVAEGNKDTKHYKVKVHADGKEETPALANQPNLGMSPYERVAEKGPVQTQRQFRTVGAGRRPASRRCGLRG